MADLIHQNRAIKSVFFFFLFTFFQKKVFSVPEKERSIKVSSKFALRSSSSSHFTFFSRSKGLCKTRKMVLTSSIRQKQQLLSKIATNDGHGENSSYFDGWKAYDSDPFHPTRNPNGVIQMGLAENQVFSILDSSILQKKKKRFNL